MRAAFNDYVRENWTEGYFSSRYIPELFKEQYIKRKEAADCLHVTEDKVLELVKKGKLKGIAIGKHGKTICLVDKEEVLNQNTYCENVVNLSKAMKPLGLGRKAVIDLVKRRLLRARFHTNPWYKTEINFIDIGTLMLNISKIVKENRRTDVKSSYHFYQAISALICIKESTSSFLQAILKSDILPCGWDRQSGIKGLMFSKNDLDKYRNMKLKKINGKLVPISKAATIFGMKAIEPFYELVRRKLICAVQLPGKKQKPLRIEKKMLTAFVKLYISADEMAARLRIPSENAARMAINYGVLPVSGASVDGGLQYVFKRSDVDKLLLTERKSIATDPKLLLEDEDVEYLYGEQIRIALNLSMNDFIKYSRIGYLNPAWPADCRRQGIDRYYRRDAVKRLQQKLKKQKELLTTTEAARELGETNLSFHNRWVLSERIKRVRVHERSPERPRYKREDVEEIKKLKMTTIRGSKAAQILNICSGTLQYWRAIGRIKPVSGPTIDGKGYYLYLISDIEEIEQEKLMKIS